MLGPSVTTSLDAVLLEYVPRAGAAKGGSNVMTVIGPNFVSFICAVLNFSIW